MTSGFQNKTEIYRCVNAFSLFQSKIYLRTSRMFSFTIRLATAVLFPGEDCRIKSWVLINYFSQTVWKSYSEKTDDFQGHTNWVVEHPRYWYEVIRNMCSHCFTFCLTSQYICQFLLSCSSPNSRSIGLHNVSTHQNHWIQGPCSSHQENSRSHWNGYVYPWEHL